MPGGSNVASRRCCARWSLFRTSGAGINHRRTKNRGTTHAMPFRKTRSSPCSSSSARRTGTAGSGRAREHLDRGPSALLRRLQHRCVGPLRCRGRQRCCHTKSGGPWRSPAEIAFFNGFQSPLGALIRSRFFVSASMAVVGLHGIRRRAATSVTARSARDCLAGRCAFPKARRAVSASLDRYGRFCCHACGPLFGTRICG